MSSELPAARKKLLISAGLTNLVLLLFAAALYIGRPAPPPQIQGVLLPEGRGLPDFLLLDHHNRRFTPRDLAGRWHLVSYGFTFCPDVCPTTLVQLVELVRRLDARGHDDLRVLFYSVDHRRDTADKLATYLPFFHPDFLGLTHLDDNGDRHLPFEKGLGIYAELIPQSDDSYLTGGYQVTHGLQLFLINPQGQLQAVFEPARNPPSAAVQGVQPATGYFFDAEQILRDYLAIRDFLG